MTRRVDDVPRHRGLHLLDWQLRRDRARAVRQEPTMDATTYAMTPAGRRQLRGIPCVGTGGLDERRNPLLEVLDRERDARSRPMGEFKRIEPNTGSGLTAPPRRKTWLVTWAIEARAMDNARVYSDAPPPDQGLWPCFTAKEGGRRRFVNVAQARSIVELDDEPVVGCPACSGTGVRRKEPTDG